MQDGGRTSATMQAIARALDETLNGSANPKETGFVVLVFPFGQPEGRHEANYVSNGSREDMIATMKELIARFEGRFLDPSDAGMPV